MKDNDKGVLCVRLADTLYGIAITGPMGVLEKPRIYPLPCMPPTVLGVCDVRRGVAVVCEGRGLLCDDDGRRGVCPVFMGNGADALVIMVDAVLNFIDNVGDARTLDPPLRMGRIIVNDVLSGSEGAIPIIQPEQLLEGVRTLFLHISV